MILHVQDQQDRQTSVLSPREPRSGANLGLVGTLQGAFSRQKMLYLYLQAVLIYIWV